MKFLVPFNRIAALCAALLGVWFILIIPTSAYGKPLNVLLVTGDWKSQAWYQDVVMGGKQLYRGRFIAKKVDIASPGKFTLSQMTNYEAQEYLDSNLLQSV